MTPTSSDESAVGILLKRPTSIGVTDIPRLDKCPLSVVLTRGLDRDHLLPSTHPYALLGTLHHQLIEDAQNGTAGDPPEEARLKSRWDSNVLELEQRTRGGPDACWVPFADFIDDLERTRLRAIQMARGVSVVERSSSPGGGGARYGAEIPVDIQSGELTIKGKIDCVRRVGDAVHLIDFKSGRVKDATGQVKDEYRRQLTLYAALYERQYQTLPSYLALVDVEGEELPIAADASEIRSTLDRAEHAVEAWQRSIPSGDLTLQVIQTAVEARPATETCRHCAARHHCHAHHRRLDANGAVCLDEATARRSNWDLSGAVTDVHSSSTARNVQLRVSSTTVWLRHGGDPAIRVGDRVRVYAARSVGDGDAGDEPMPIRYTMQRWSRCEVTEHRQRQVPEPIVDETNGPSMHCATVDSESATRPVPDPTRPDAHAGGTPNAFSRLSVEVSVRGSGLGPGTMTLRSSDSTDGVVSCITTTACTPNLLAFSGLLEAAWHVVTNDLEPHDIRCRQAPALAWLSDTELPRSLSKEGMDAAIIQRITRQFAWWRALLRDASRRLNVVPDPLGGVRPPTLMLYHDRRSVLRFTTP